MDESVSEILGNNAENKIGFFNVRFNVLRNLRIYETFTTFLNSFILKHFKIEWFRIYLIFKRK